MARELDPNSLVPSGPAAWTDYLGTSPWGDFDLTYSGSTPVVSEQMRYLGTAAQQDVSGGDTRHYHGDLIGSTMLLTDEAGGTNFSPASFAYTAFGEPVTPDGSGGWRVGQPVSGAPRYAYAGQWGYETWHGSSGPMFLAGANPNLASIRLSHVGFRWYDASIGRFVHRDPIGIQGGVNVYAYAAAKPATSVDPAGLDIIVVGDIWHSGVFIEDPARDGRWWRFDYMPERLKNWWDDGQVTESPHPLGPDEPGTRYPSSPDTDAACLTEARRWMASPPYYCVPFTCCHTFTSNIRQKAGAYPVIKPQILIPNRYRGGRNVIY